MAYVVDLFWMESLRKFELISLPALMSEHMYKIMHVKDRRHIMPYWYFLNKVFNYFKIVSEKGVPGTVKQIFTMNSLIENECVEDKVGTMS